ncbi:amino acid permease [Thermoanaerobacterium sp. RBIITD]|uniref:APC family permease n=1 Tax=Thermoanaerobacterium sp. RBIITD TaxID=1550240 RepID=UPI000BB88CBF|nr:amino acid permease [Thermoanaerobacterium sp. RBIITD]SNX54668.1 Amino acid transporter [Thermoanaerobacterium sp. RBIITD]
MDKNTSIFVRQSTGLVREASFLDTAIFTAAFSAPVGVTLAFGVFWALGAFPGTDIVLATALSIVLDIPILIMMAYMASSMPRTGGDYIWVSRIISPPIAVISNFAAALSACIGAAYWARVWASMCIGPSFTILGNVLNNKVLANIGKIAGTSGWTYFFAIFLTLILALSLSAGTKKMFKIQNICFFIAMGGTLLAFLVFIFGNQTTFIGNFNHFAQQFTNSSNSYKMIIENAKAAGLTLTASHSFSATLPTIGCIMTFMLWNFWSVYLAGEMKSAGNRKRQLSIMLTALLWDAGFIIIGALLLFRVAGYNFVQSINFLYSNAPKKYPLPVPPYYNLFAGMITKNSIINILIAITFLFWNLPAMVGNTFMPIRTLFAWSFDRILPEKLSEVNEKTHSPIPAIIVITTLVVAIITWSTFSSSFFTLLSLGVVCGIIVISIVSISAIMFPYVQKDLYKSSPANVNLFGIPVLVITGVLSLLVMGLLTYLLVMYPALGISSPKLIIEFVAAVILIGLAIYYSSYIIQKRKGIDINLAYKELPPE